MSKLNKPTIKFTDIKPNQTIQMIDMDDYFGGGIPLITPPLTKEEFTKEYLQEIIDDAKEDDEDLTVDEAWELMTDYDGGGDSNKVFITVIDNEAHVIKEGQGSTSDEDEE